MATTYWRGAAEDEAMQDEHGFVWRAMLETIDVDLTGVRVLDAGCNRGGFLRLLADRCGIAEGLGYDPASGAVADAARLAGDRPLRFEAGDTVPPQWRDVDVAFSHEVLYLIRDMAGHAEAIHDALRPGGVYFAVMGAHSGSQMMAEWHAEHAEELDLPPLYDIGDVVATFGGVGFDASAARLAVRFVPAGGHGHHDPGRLLDWMQYYYEDKLLLRFGRPQSRPQ